MCGIDWMYTLEKQQQCDPFITDCKNSWKNHLTRYQQCLNVIKPSWKGISLALAFQQIGTYVHVLSGNTSCPWESAESGKNPTHRKAVAFVTPLAVVCSVPELLGREEVLLSSAGAVVALAEHEQFSSVQASTCMPSPELCFSPVLAGEPLESQVCK